MVESAIVHGIAAASGAATATLLLQPLDVAKISLQSSRYTATGSSFASVLTDVVRRRGLGAAYAGLTPNLMGNMLAWGSYMAGYRTIRERLYATAGRPDPSSTRAAVLNGTASAVASTASQLLTNPLWFLKTRMALAASDPALGASRAPGPSMVATARAAIAADGVLVLWRGSLASLAGVSHGIVQMVIYERLKAAAADMAIVAAPADGVSGLSSKAVLYIGLGSLAKSGATLITYPYQVTRTQLQQVGGDRRIRDVVRRIVATSGPAGFYRGLVAALVRVVPQAGITFSVYELIASLLTS